MVEQLEDVLAYNDSLAAIATKAEKSSLPAGIGPVTVLGK